MKKILVTGGAGFIGSAVISELQATDYEVFVIDDLSFGNRAHIDLPDACFFEDSILNKSRLREIFEEVKPDAVVHLAAIHFIPYCNEHPYEAANINIMGTINLLDIIRETESVQKVFFASTAAVYPISDDAVKEDHATGPLDIYGLTKYTGERLLREFHLDTGTATVICRFFNAFGPNETNPHVIPEIQEQINVGERTIMLGNLEPKRDFIHTHDMARAVRMLLEQFEEGLDVFNLGRGIEYSIKEVVEAFERQIGEPVTILQDPNRVRKSDRLHLLADISKLTAFTGWEPQIGLDEGIKTLIRIPVND